MIPIQSNLEGHTYALFKLEEVLKPLGYSIGGNWDYDKGCFDYKVDEEDGYQFLRVPFTAVEGELDVPGVVVRLDTPYLLSHVYQDELDDQVNTLAAGASGLDQFAEPQDADGNIKRKYIDIGKALVKELEKHLINV
ncbi:MULTISPECIES: YugN-like family protein [Bacillus]|uniref:YugN-like family protein n=1 Tax=Bacillus pseudomycoides TaxID=64104 RepID=A0AAJ1Z7L8_9BACI|nr:MULTISPECIES: YugN-like family protein [Bacillus]AIK40715.1 yugN-like family protein [Bacillus pseudomycoides]AJI15596.1 yugN-like family protein [Bacillus pseudomycoides]KFN13304.1 yugN-like family protein [Bacillus pseudomycoides]MBJ8030495.1 YugN-like family protein [Bacillus cereus group sp. N21]MCR8860172.1 YugN-like family protein [Bacillus pseudomycoides]